MDHASHAYVYQGLWNNWKYGSYSYGTTITLSARNGGILTAFLAIFEIAACVALWRTLSCIIRQLRTGENPQAGLHDQQQEHTIVQNVGTTGPASRWRLARRKLGTSLLLVLLALANLAVFAFVGVPYYIGANALLGDEVLLRGDTCGYWMVNETSDCATRQSAVMRKNLKDTTAAASYARSCYGCSATNPQLCNQYVTRQIQYTTNRNATCPFAPDICLNATAAFSLDTGYLSSLQTLGVNTRQQDSITYRRKTTCSPITDEGYITSGTWTTPDSVNLASSKGRSGGIVDLYMFGQRRSGGTLQNGPSDSTFYYFREAANILNVYGLSTISFSLGNGIKNDWLPVDALRRRDADVSMMFLERNGVAYLGPVYDPVFQATVKYLAVNPEVANQNRYRSNSFVSLLVCIDQHQICNQIKGLCNELDSYSRAVEVAQSHLELSPVQSELIKLLALDLPFETISGIIGTRGAGALRAQELVQNGVSAPLPSDQWMIEVENWFATGLAQLQQHFVQYAIGPSDLIEGMYPRKPQDPIARMLCNAQKIRSTGGTTNFSLYGLIHLLAGGAFLIVINRFLDTIVGFLQRRRNIRDYQRNEWVTEDKVDVAQLERLGVQSKHGYLG